MIDGREHLLLDTHCWVWSQLGYENEFSKAGLATLKQAADDGALLVSIISVWEIALLESKRRLDLFMDCLDWVEQALETPGLTLVPLNAEIAVDSTRLPGNIHADPADRILVATARHTGAQLMTRDNLLLDYGRQRHARIISA